MGGVWVSALHGSRSKSHGFHSQWDSSNIYWYANGAGENLCGTRVGITYTTHAPRDQGFCAPRCRRGTWVVTYWCIPVHGAAQNAPRCLYGWRVGGACMAGAWGCRPPMPNIAPDPFGAWVVNVVHGGFTHTTPYTIYINTMGALGHGGTWVCRPPCAEM
jgi:hypothetical protein